jgi:hypothetical protein
MTLSSDDEAILNMFQIQYINVASQFLLGMFRWFSSTFATAYEEVQAFLNINGEGTRKKPVIATQPQFPRIIITLSRIRGTEWSSANSGNGNAITTQLSEH